MSRLTSLAWLTFVPILTASGCESIECGDGTVESGGACVPSGAVVCGAGTMLAGGECRPDGTSVACAKGTMLESGMCVPSAEACGEGTSLDATGVCVPGEAIACGEGTMQSGGECVPDPEQLCRPGTTFDPETAGCVANLSCRSGEVAVDGLCLSPEEIDASMADVVESNPDTNDPGFGGTPETLPPPAIGESTIFTGGIGAPADLDGDFDLDQDWDYWSFDAAAGDTFELVLRSLGSTELGFVVTGPNGYRRMSPLYFQPEPSRHLVVPYDGAYTIAIAPQLVIERVTDADPVGGAEYEYVAVLEHEPFPAASDLAPGAPVDGELFDLTDNLHQLRAPAGSLVRIDVASTGDDAQPILLVFDGAGDFVSELAALPPGGLVHRTGTADDLILLMDWVRLVGEDDGYSIDTLEITPIDAGTVPPGGTVTSSTIAIGAGETGYFIAGVSPGEIVELAVIGGATPPDLRVIAPSGELAAAALDARDARFYAAVGGDYTIEIVNDDAGSATFSVMLTSITPVAIGPLDPIAETATVAFWEPEVPPFENAYFVVSAAQPVQLDVAASQQGNANLGLTVYDVHFDALRSLPLGGTAPMLSAFLPNGGEAIVEVLNSSPGADVVGLTLDAFVAALPPLEDEPNDDPSLATPLALDSPLAGEIEAGDSDFFRITLLAPLAAGELLEVRATEPTETDVYTCQLRDRTGAIIQEQTPRHLGCVIFAGGLGAGDHYFLLQKAETTLRVYEVVASIIPGVLESEPNDAVPGNTITDLSGATPMYGESALNTDADIFTFTLGGDLAADQILTVRADTVGTRPTGTMQAGLTGPNGLNTAFAVAPSGAAIRAGLTAGEYRIRMSRTSANGAFDGHYRITVSTASVSVTEAEPNDGPVEAQGMGPLPATAIGLIEQPTTGDEDWYSFALPQDLAAGETLAVRLYRIGQQPTEAVRVSLFDSNQTFLGSSNFGDPRLIPQTGLAAGTFYVRVDGTFNSTLDADYLLAVSIE